MNLDSGGTWIRISDRMPYHPKIEALSDRGFRLLVTSWCWCSERLTDGLIPARIWNKRGVPAARRELIEAGLVDELADGSVQMHDYLDWQRSAAEAAEASEQKKAAGRKGAHERWHRLKGGFDPDCELCRPRSNVTDIRPKAQ